MIVDRGKNKNSISKFLFFRRVDNSYNVAQRKRKGLHNKLAIKTK
jgi:hypothetical protein